MEELSSLWQAKPYSAILANPLAHSLAQEARIRHEWSITMRTCMRLN